MIESIDLDEDLLMQAWCLQWILKWLRYWIGRRFRIEEVCNLNTLWEQQYLVEAKNIFNTKGEGTYLSKRHGEVVPCDIDAKSEMS